MHAVGNGDNADVAAPPAAGLTGSDLQSHPLGGEPLPGKFRTSPVTLEGPSSESAASHCSGCPFMPVVAC